MRHMDFHGMVKWKRSPRKLAGGAVETGGIILSGLAVWGGMVIKSNERNILIRKSFEVREKPYARESCSNQQG